MKKEKSCGAVTFCFRDNVIYYLIEHMALGHYSLPKGHVEENETEIETAKREIKEETNLEVIIDNNFRQVITYSPYEGIIKDVVFFVAEIKSGDIISQLSEVSDIRFLPYKEAGAQPFLGFHAPASISRNIIIFSERISDSQGLLLQE